MSPSNSMIEHAGLVDRERLRWIRKNSLLSLFAVSGAAWVGLSLADAILFLLSQRGFIWDGHWSDKLVAFESFSAFFQLGDNWVPPFLRMLMTPEFPDTARFLAALVGIGALMGVLTGLGGWLAGVLVSILGKQRWDGAAWGVGFVFASVLYAIALHFQEFWGDLMVFLARVFMFIGYFTSYWDNYMYVIIHFSSRLVFFVALVALCSFAARRVRSRLGIGNKPRRPLASALMAAPFLLATALSWQALRAPTPILPFGPQDAVSNKPLYAENVLLITIDTLRYDHTSMGGYGRDTTPGLARLAEDGVTFDRCFTPSSWTLPSMKSIVTGLSPMAHGFESKFIKPNSNIPALPEILQRRGIRTAAIYTNFFTSSHYGFDRGFDDYEQFNVIENFKKGKQVAAGEAIDKVLAWLGDNHEKGRFFLTVHLFDPHYPYDPPPPYDQLYHAGRLPDDMDDKMAIYRRLDQDMPLELLTTAIARYDGEIRYVDDQIGRVVEKMKLLGIYDRTMIIVTSDHGEEFEDHKGLEHGRTLYREVTHVPLIIRFPQETPSCEPGSRQERLVTLVDLAPTILDAMGLASHPGFSGYSLLQPDSPASNSTRKSVHASNYSEISLIKDGFKYIHDYSPDGRKEKLYDMRTDPAELANLVEDRKEKTRLMRRLVFDWLKQERQLKYFYSTSMATVDLDENTIRQLEAIGYIE